MNSTWMQAQVKMKKNQWILREREESFRVSPTPDWLSAFSMISLLALRYREFPLFRSALLLHSEKGGRWEEAWWRGGGRTGKHLSNNTISASLLSNLCWRVLPQLSGHMWPNVFYRHQFTKNWGTALIASSVLVNGILRDLIGNLAAPKNPHQMSNILTKQQCVGQMSVCLVWKRSFPLPQEKIATSS